MNELNLAKTLVSKRREKGITQDDLANYIGVSKASVSKWETGQSYPDITFLPQLATYFNISVDELIDYQPQMERGDIRKLYLCLSKDFAEKPFDDVMDEIDEIIKKYYSCFPLLYQMGVLLANHCMLAKETEQQDILNKAVGLFERIKSESQDFVLSKRSNSMEAMCCFFLVQPAKIINLLEDSNNDVTSDRGLLAMGYSMNNQPDKATEILQVDIYQNVLNLIQDLLVLLSLETANAEVAGEIINRIRIIAEGFDITHLHPATMLQVYMNEAVTYMMQSDTENTLSALQKYGDLAASNIYPVTLHGDKFFNKIDTFITELDLGSTAPRSEKTLKQGIIDAVVENPVFDTLSENSRYKNLVEKLTTVLGG